jgi:hypothetical protein
VPVALDGEALVSALVQVAAATRVVVCVVPADVRDAHPTHERRQRAVRPWREDQMPVVAHQAVGQQVDAEAVEPLGQHAFEGGEVAVLVEQPHAAVATVGHVVDRPGLLNPQRTWHADRLSATGTVCQEK